MRMPRDLGPRMQAAAQELVDWYAATYGPARARCYLGTCEKHGLALPPSPPASAARWKAGLAIAALLLGLVLLGGPAEHRVRGAGAARVVEGGGTR